jgi:LPXTG-motif cell wall-anchored protein
LQSIRKRSFKRISTAVLAILLVLALLPATADARVNPFGNTPPEGSGSGGGVAEAAPRGFGIDLNGKEEGGLVWLSSQYDNFNWCAVYTGITNGHQEEIPAVDENGDPIIYYLNAYVHRNPGNISGNTEENPEPFIILYKDGERVSLAGTIMDNGEEVQKVGPLTQRGAPDRAGNLVDPSGQGRGNPPTEPRWTVPMTLTFEPGHTYEFAFAQGFICNNKVVNMISEDGTGYYQDISQDKEDPERKYYEAHKYDEFMYREYLYQTYMPNTPPDRPGQPRVYMGEEYKNPNVGKMRPMRFTLKTAPLSVTGVSLDKEEATISAGSTDKLTATVVPEGATNKNVTWSSSNEDVATVAADGTVTAIAPGKATITVTTEDGGHTDECVITVPGLVITSKITKMTIGDTATATADYFGPETQLIWTSSDKKIIDIAKPTNAGVRSSDIATTAQLTAKSVGTATISVKTVDGEMVAEFDVTVEPKTITPDGGTIKPGPTGTVTKTVSKGATPKTGDNSLMASGLMLLVAAGATGVGALRRRREH